MLNHLPPYGFLILFFETPLNEFQVFRPPKLFCLTMRDDIN
jgi:hypothetical protein